MHCLAARVRLLPSDVQCALSRQPTNPLPLLHCRLAAAGPPTRLQKMCCCHSPQTLIPASALPLPHCCCPAAAVAQTFGTCCTAPHPASPHSVGPLLTMLSSFYPPLSPAAVPLPLPGCCSGTNIRYMLSCSAPTTNTECPPTPSWRNIKAAPLPKDTPSVVRGNSTVTSFTLTADCSCSEAYWGVYHTATYRKLPLSACGL